MSTRARSTRPSSSRQEWASASPAAPDGAQIPKPLLPLDDSGKLTFLDWHLRALAAHGAQRDLHRRQQGHVRHEGRRDGRTSRDVDHERLPRRRVGQRSLDASRVHERTRHPRRQVARRPDGRRRRLRSLALRRARARRVRSARRRSSAGASARPTKRSWSSATIAACRASTARGSSARRWSRTSRAWARRRASCSSSRTITRSWLGAAAWCMKFSTAKTRTEHEDITQRLFAMGALDAVVFDDDDALHGVRHARRVRGRSPRDGPALGSARCRGERRVSVGDRELVVRPRPGVVLHASAEARDLEPER